MVQHPYYKRLALVVSLTLLWLGLTAAAVAQNSSGTITGSVQDVSHANIVGALVTLIDQRTGDERSAKTDTDASFTFPQVSPGLYKLNVTATGFALYSEHDIDIHINQNYTVNAVLPVASETAQVNVNATDLTINTDSSEISSLIDPKQIKEIPLNGRNFLQLLTLVPGSSPGDNLNTFQTGLLSVTRFSLSGTGDDASVYTVDGAQMRDPGGNNVIPVFPSIDAVQEFRVQTNAYGPQFGGGGGAQVNILTRSGGNQFHGTAYDFVRNDLFDANTYLLNSIGAKRPKLRYNDFGYTLGGPIKREKLFFFFSQEFRRQEIGSTRSATVPTDLERIGDFSADAALYNSLGCYLPTPSSGQVTTQGGCSTFPINPVTRTPLGYVGPGVPLNTASAVVPAAQFNQSGKTFLQLYPSPTKANAIQPQNWIQAVNIPIDTREESGKVDYKFNESLSALVRYTHDSWVNGPQSYEENLWGDDGFPKVNNTWNSPADTLAVRLIWTHTTSANTLGYSRTAGNTAISPGTGADLNAAAVAAIPTFYQKTGTQPHALFWGAGAYPTLWSNAGFQNDFGVHTISDDYSKVFGKHSVVAGLVYNRGSKNDQYGGCGCSDVPQFGGAYGYNNDPTGVTNNAASDFLFKGITFGFSEINASPRVNARYNNLEFYAGDTFKLRTNLTVNYGFRWSFLRMPYAANDNIASFSPGAWTAAKANDAQDGLVLTGGTYGRSLIHNQNNLIAPRVGVSWDVLNNGKTILRSGFGQFFATVQSSGQFLQLGGNPPFIKTLSGRRYLDTATGFDNSGNPLTAAAASTGRPQNGIDPNLQNPTTYQWNLSISQQLSPNHVFQVAYVGNRGNHNYIKNDINQVLPQYRGACFQARQTGGGCAAYRPFGSGVIGDNGITYLTWGGTSIYHGLQTSYQGRVGKNTQFNLNYTWSKLMGDTGLTDFGASPTITDTYNPKYDYSVLSYDRTNIFSANYVYALPTFRGMNSLVREVVGGWQIAGITSLASGAPLTIGAGLNYDYTSVGSARPDLAPGRRERQIKSRTEWFDTSAYTVTGHVVGQLGTVRRFSVRAPGIANQDLSLDKSWDFPFVKSAFTSERASLQFRAESFNVFNHTQPLGVDTNLGAQVQFDPAYSRVVSSTNTNSNFGHVTSYRSPRQIQLGLKLNF